MDPISVFVSSTYRDKEWREAAIQAIRRLPDFSPVLVEESQATMRAPEQTVADEIAKSDIVVLIVGTSYGTFAPRREQSFTELEYDLAVKAGKPIIAFMLKDPVLENKADAERLAGFRERLVKNHIVSVFDSSQGLRTELSESLLRLKEERFGQSFNIAFDPELTDQEVQAAFRALADYFRAGGGVGFEVEFEREEAEVRELLNV